EQVELLINLKTFQIDMSYKCIKGDINEFEINTYDKKYKLILSYCRIYTNISLADGYKKLFNILFNTIQELTNKPLYIYHIHSKGWECIIGDLDAGQAKGLGLALYELDQSKDWESHLMHIFKSCIIHFQRKISSTNIKEKRVRQNNSQVTNIIEIESDNDLQDTKNEIQAESSGNTLLNEINK
ncbi:25910_t:CDS:2, partial [Racocetra persica]